MKTLREKLEAKLAPGENGCLEFIGYRDRCGYGKIFVDSKALYTHRVAWELQNGKIPDGLHVLHRCDVPSCCNPEHLFLGTPADNMADMVQKGRQRYPGNGNRVVDSDTAHMMFILAVEGHAQQSIGERLGVSQMTVHRYLSGKQVVR